MGCINNFDSGGVSGSTDSDPPSQQPEHHADPVSHPTRPLLSPLSILTTTSSSVHYLYSLPTRPLTTPTPSHSPSLIASPRPSRTRLVVIAPTHLAGSPNNPGHPPPFGSYPALSFSTSLRAESHSAARPVPSHSVSWDLLRATHNTGLGVITHRG